MIRVLDSGLSGPCSSPGWGHCVMLKIVKDTFKLPSLCLSPLNVYTGYRQT